MPWIVGCWILGIFVGISTQQAPRVWPGVVALAVATLLAMIGGGVRAKLWLVLLALLAGLAGLGVGTLPTPPAARGLYRATGQVLDVRQRASNQRARLRLEQVVALDESPSATLAGAEVDVSFPLGTVIPEGARVRALVRLRPPPRFYNRSPHPAWPVDATPAAIGTSVAESPPSVLEVPLVSRWLAETREGIRSGIDATLDERVSGLVQALVLGDAGAAAQDQRDAMRDAGMAHLLAVSGLHVGLIGLFVVSMLRRVFVRMDVLRPERWAALTGIPLVVAHAHVAGGSASALRAAFTACLALALCALGRRPRPMALMAGACLLLGFLDPRATVNPGFWLSVSATAAILTAPTQPEARYPALATAWSITYRTTVATAPITCWSFAGVPLLGLLANLVVLPLGALFVVPLANAHAVLGWISSAAAQTISAPVLTITCTALVRAASVFAQPGWGLGLPPLSLSEGIAVAFGCCSLLAARPRLRVLGVALACLGFAAAEVSLRHHEAPLGRLRVTFLDVGQGDSAIVDLPNGEAMLIDAGGGVPDPGARVVAPLLAARRRRALRAVMISHPHPDHFGGLASVLDTVRTQEIWDTGQGPSEHPDAPYSALLGELSRRGVRILGPAQLCGTRELGGARMELMWPCPRFDAGHDPNDNSFVMRLRYGERSVLFVGDAEQEAEHALLELDAPLASDVLKVGHHGSRTSSTDAFLAAVRPTLAVASQGRDNQFGHPHRDVVERFGRLGIPLLLTSRVGGVTISTEGRRWSVETARSDGASRAAPTSTPWSLFPEPRATPRGPPPRVPSP